MKIKKEKGSITLLVLISGTFFVIILLLLNIGIINKNIKQEKMISQIERLYSLTENDLEKTYNKILNKN